jgi:hypothetical protein
VHAPIAHIHIIKTRCLAHRTRLHCNPTFLPSSTTSPLRYHPRLGLWARSNTATARRHETMRLGGTDLHACKTQPSAPTNAMSSA